jgi:hypothetical protein
MLYHYEDYMYKYNNNNNPGYKDNSYLDPNHRYSKPDHYEQYNDSNTEYCNKADYKDTLEGLKYEHREPDRGEYKLKELIHEGNRTVID